MPPYRTVRMPYALAASGPSGAYSSAPVERRNSLPFVVFSIMYLIGAFMDVPGPAGAPMFSAFPFAILAFAVFANRIVTRTTAYAVLLPVLIYAMSFAAPEPLAFMGTRTVAFAQFLYTIFIAVTFFYVVRSYSARSLTRFIEFAIPIVIILAVLEIVTPLSKLIDTYLLPLYHSSDTDFAQIVANRDMGIGGGFRRPKLIASETSYFALAYAFMVCTFVYLTPHKKTIIRGLAYSLVGVVVIRSPIAVIATLFVGITWIMRMSSSRRSQAMRQLALILVIGTPLIAAGLYLVQMLFEARLQQVSSGADYSATYRTYGSLYAAIATAREMPLFGVGIGSIDLAYGPLTQTFLSLGVPAFAVFEEWRFQVQNLPSALLIYLGMVGSSIYLLYQYHYIKYVTRGARWELWFLLAVLAATASAFYSPRFNVYYFLVLAITRIRNDMDVDRRRTRGTPVVSRRTELTPSGAAFASRLR